MDVAVRTDPPFSAQALNDASYWGSFLGNEWARDFPTQIHEGRIGPDGLPRWQAEFMGWLNGSRDPDEDRHRTTRVMRRLRRASPREYECMYRILLLGESFEEVTQWLNERAARNDIPLPPGRSVHYRVKDAVALFICGVEFARYYF